jgi:HK97 gp10 family phage protein
MGAASLMKKLEQKTDEYANKLEAAVTSAALIVENDAKDKAPYKTGTLKRSITHETKEKSHERVVVAVGTNLIYAGILEFGGTIESKSGGYLVFKTDDGEWHSVSSVQIPARPYLRPALDQNKAKIVKEIGDALRSL